MSNDIATRASNEEVLRWLNIKTGQVGNGADPEYLSTVTTFDRFENREVTGTLRASDLQQVLYERREAIELLAAYVRGDAVHTAAVDFLGTIVSEA